MKNFLVIGECKPLVIQLLLGLHAFTDAKCTAVCARGTRFVRLSTMCSHYLEVAFTGEDDGFFVERANHLAKSAPDLVLIAADCCGAQMINRVREQLCMRIAPVPESAMLDSLDDKWQFYLLCKSLGLRVPESRLVADKAELDFASIARDLGLPFIVKPVNEDSSRGAYIIASESQYQTEIRDNPGYRYAPLIAQTFIVGHDVGLNFCSSKGNVTAIAIQKRVEPGHDGSRIEFFFDPYLQQVAHKVAGALAYDGVMNIDARIQDGTGAVFLFESNPRFWRSLSASVWCELNFAAECIDPPPATGVRLLDAGSADTFYHPVFRPSMWKYVLFDRGHRGRMARIMLCDVTILFTSAMTLWLRYRAAARRWFDSMRGQIKV